MSWSEEDRNCGTCGQGSSISSDTLECSDCYTKRERDENGLSACRGAAITSLNLCSECSEPAGPADIDPVNVLIAHEKEYSDDQLVFSPSWGDVGSVVGAAMRIGMKFVAGILLAFIVAAILMAPILMDAKDLNW